MREDIVMQFSRSVLCRLMFALYAFVPACFLMALLFGYEAVLFHNLIASVLFALLSILFTDRLLRAETAAGSKPERLLFGLLPLLSIINWVLYLPGAESPWLIVSMLICLVCSLIVSSSFLKLMAIKFLNVLLSVLLVLPLSFISLFSSLGHTTVRETVTAPNGRYYIEVVDSDQGALGGDTLVNVHKGRKLNLLVLSFEKTPETVYVGNWKEPVYISWKNDSCLVVNGTEYSIP